MKMRISGSMAKRLHWCSGAVALGIALLPAGYAAAQEEGAEAPVEQLDPVESPETAGTVHTMDQGGEAVSNQSGEPAAPFSDDQLQQIRKEMAGMPKPFEYHGYFRSGFGFNERLGDQEAFGARGAGAKYRLGNETETYIESTLVANWTNPESDGAWFKSVITLAFVAGENSTFDVFNAAAFREVYAEAGRVLESHPEATVWAGSRFYRRRDVHINDFFYQDMSGYGAGFQDLDLGVGKLAVAYLGGSNDALVTEQGRFVKSNVDIRFYGIDIGTGTLEFWVNPVLARGDDTLDSGHGISGGVFHTLNGFMGGFNELSVQFGYGGGSNFSTGIADPATVDGAWMLRAVERATVQLSEPLSMMWGGVVQLDNTDGGNEGGNLWVSAGVRPIYNFTKYAALAVEGGLDFVQPDGGDAGFLGKLTVAPILRPGMGFWARPEIRAFATAAFWNDAIAFDPLAPDLGGVGGATYADKTFGMSFGVQAESWF